jgi:hypothetical protein
LEWVRCNPPTPPPPVVATEVTAEAGGQAQQVTAGAGQPQQGLPERGTSSAAAAQGLVELATTGHGPQQTFIGAYQQGYEACRSEHTPLSTTTLAV